MDNQELIRKVFVLVKQELERLNGGSPVVSADNKVSSSDVVMFEVSKNVISECDVRQALASGAGEMLISQKAIITCLADEYANKYGIAFVRK